jgi:flagellar FliJ protein
MKTRDTLIRLRRFEVDEKRQQVADIETMLADFRRMATDLDRQIEVEQEQAGVSDVNHHSYPTFAKAAIERRDNLMASVQDLEEKLAHAQDNLAEAYEELKKVEMIEQRGIMTIREQEEKQDLAELDEFAGSLSTRSY